jgi:hypothetical protein
MKYFNGMFGLGDSIYQRAVVRELCKDEPVYLATAWPQLYRDLNVRAVRPQTRLRTQHKNIQRQDLLHLWYTPPVVGGQRLAYDGTDTILASLFRSAGINPPTVKFDLPSFPKQQRRPYVVVRPATIRTEWIATSRNPDPKYLCRAVDMLRDEFDIVSVADLDGVAEYAVEPMPYADQKYHRGELQVEDLLSLVENAAGVVGGVGWVLPAALAYRTPLLLIYGGWGAVNGAHKVLDQRLPMDKLHQVFPDRFCMCNDRVHACDRTISDLDKHIENFKQVITKNATVPQ